MDHPVAVESFSIVQAADALGKSAITLRRWIDADKIPAPYLQDVSKKNYVYSAGELRVVARVLSQHEREFTYLVSEHNHVVETLHQAVHAYRSEFI
jgi:hypothetical protein